MAIINGWGRGTWGQLTWGEGHTSYLTGLAATSALGLSPGAKATVTLAG